MQLISYKDETGNTYWLVYDCDTSDKDSKKELDEIMEKGWDVVTRIEDIDMEELASLKYFLDQFIQE